MTTGINQLLPFIYLLVYRSKGLSDIYTINLPTGEMVVFSPLCVALTQSFRGDATAVSRVDHPVVVFQGVHQLQHRAHSADGVIDRSSPNELS